MTAITRKAQKKAHEKIDQAIEDSVMESPAPVNVIARKTGFHPTQVYRRFLEIGWRYENGRWVWRYNPPKGEA